MWLRVWLRAAQTERGNARGGATKKCGISRTLLSINLHFSVPYDGVNPEVKVCEHGEGDDAGHDEPGHVDVPQYVTLVESERRWMEPLACSNVLLEREGMRGV